METPYIFIVHSCVALINDLLSIPDVEYVLTEKLNQDPLEQYFGKQRSRGGSNDNPTVDEFAYNTTKIAVAGSSMIRDVGGNVRKRNVPIDINANVPMMKRMKKK